MRNRRSHSRPKRRVHWLADRSIWNVYRNPPAGGQVQTALTAIPSTGIADPTYAAAFSIMSLLETGASTQPLATLAQVGGAGPICKRIVGEWMWSELNNGIAAITAYGSCRAAIVCGTEFANGIALPDLFDPGDQAERRIVSQRDTPQIVAGAGVAQCWHYDQSYAQWDVSPNRRLESGEGLFFTVQYAPPVGTGAGATFNVKGNLWMRALFAQST